MDETCGEVVKQYASDADDECIENTLYRVKKIVNNLKVSRETVNIAERDLAEAESNYKFTKRKFDSGACDSGEVSEALESLTRANLTSYQARYDFQIAMIGLEEILSMDIDGECEPK